MAVTVRRKRVRQTIDCDHRAGLGGINRSITVTGMESSTSLHLREFT